MVMIRRLRKGEHGQALVEMALVLPLLFLLLFGVIEMGRIGYAYITVSNAARAGGRTATIGGTDLDINSSIKNAAVSLDPASLTITITPLQSLRQSGQSVTVQVSYPVLLIIPIISNVIPNPVVVSSSIIMRLE
jgi:Flp pilus assembly protein TadG